MPLYRRTVQTTLKASYANHYLRTSSYACCETATRKGEMMNALRRHIALTSATSSRCRRSPGLPWHPLADLVLDYGDGKEIVLVDLGVGTQRSLNGECVGARPH